MHFLNNLINYEEDNNFNIFRRQFSWELPGVIQKTKNNERTHLIFKKLLENVIYDIVANNV